jgi:hypothetical protein
MPRPSSTEPRLSRQKSGSAYDWRAPLAASTRQRWVPEAEQSAAMTFVPLSKSPSSTSRHRLESTFTTWVKEPSGGPDAGGVVRVGVGVGFGVGVGVGVGLGEAGRVDFVGLGNGDRVVADGIGGGENVDVNVTDGGCGGVSTAPADSCDPESPCVSR